MCFHTLLHHSCKHLSWCPELLVRCRRLTQDLENYHSQPNRPETFAETSWTLPVPQLCTIYWPIIFNPTIGQSPGLPILHRELQSDGDPDRQRPWQPREDQGRWVYAPQPYSYTHPTPLILPSQTPPNVMVKMVSWGCGKCAMPGPQYDGLSCQERLMALAEEFDLVCIMLIVLLMYLCGG